MNLLYSFCYIILLSFSLGFFPSAKAQFFLTEFSSIAYDGDDFFIAHGEITNNFPSKTKFRWIRAKLDLPLGWESSICDAEACHLSKTDSADFELTVGQTGILDCNFYLSLKPEIGAGEVELLVYPLFDKSLAKRVRYLGQLLGFTSVGNTSLSQLRKGIYYNENTYQLHLTNYKEEFIESLSIIDSRGFSVLQKYNCSKTIDLKDVLISKGIYFVQTVVENKVLSYKLLIK